jgi:inositol transporter-like SP family MFS transporter
MIHEHERDRPGAPCSGWQNTILAGLANYIDGGSIAACAAALALWGQRYDLSPRYVGMLGALSANALSAAMGAMVGGFLSDRVGRKKLYQYDMLLYAFGMSWLVFACHAWMIVVGIVIVGFAVGADIPASWSLIAEAAPDKRRGAHSGIAQVLWASGPAVVLIMSLLFAPLGLFGARLVFAHLLIVALLMTYLRSKMKESERWLNVKLAKDNVALLSGNIGKRKPRSIGQPEHIRSMIFLIGVYGFWNLWAGTIGMFLIYILRNVAEQTQETAITIQIALTPLSFVSLIFIFIKYVDRVHHKILFGFSSLTQCIGMLLLALFPHNIPIILTFLVLSCFGYTQAFYQLWSSELFPTEIRSTAQGATFAVVRLWLGIWSLFVPALATAHFAILAWCLTGFLIMSGLIGFVWAPQTAGKSLEQIQTDREVPKILT